jgi:acyl-lipid omega-6 desaturase (Delta-12 desaturase)
MTESPRLRALIDRARLSREIAPFGRSSTRKGTWQLVNTIVPYLGLLALMVYGRVHGWPWPVTLALALPTAALMIRVFIFFHDCCHDSFFASHRANRITGFITGVLTFTPFDDWKYSHQRHHTTAGDLDQRGTGDVWTMTVEEYLAASRRKRLGYRLVRNPFFLLLVVPFYLSLIAYRIPRPSAGRAAVLSVLFTDLALVAIAVAASLTFGLKTYLLVQLPVIVISWTSGVWLFYVQHQFEGTHWSRHEDWDPLDAALLGSSYYKLPRVLQWFTGNIGLHHIHHLRPRIPNYHLQACQDAVPALQHLQPLTLRRSLRSMAMNLWDEQQQKLVSFRAIRGRPRRRAWRSASPAR